MAGRGKFYGNVMFPVRQSLMLTSAPFFATGSPPPPGEMRSFPDASGTWRAYVIRSSALEPAGFVAMREGFTPTHEGKFESLMLMGGVLFAGSETDTVFDDAERGATLDLSAAFDDDGASWVAPFRRGVIFGDDSDRDDSLCLIQTHLDAREKLAGLSVALADPDDL